MAGENDNIPDAPGRNERLPRWVPYCIAAVALLVYLNTLPNGFVFDDIPVVAENTVVRSLSKTPEMFSTAYGEGTRLGFTALYRPVAIFSFALNYRLGGLPAWHYHLVNCLLHAANALLVVLLVSRLTDRRLVIVAAGLLFALHPVNTEAVAPVVGRTDLLGTMFSLGALLLYDRYLSATRHKKLLFSGSLACLAAGLLSKEHAVAVPAFIMLWDLTKGEGGFKKFFEAFPGRLLARYSLYILVACAYIAARWAVVGRIGVGKTISTLDNPLVALDQPARLLTAGKVSLAYLSRLLAPLTLAHDYSYPQIRPAGAAEGLAFLFVLLVFAWALARSYGKDRRVFFGLAFFALAFSIVSNLVFLIGTIMAERLLYLPGIGFCIAAAALLEAGRRRLATWVSPRSALAAAICVLAAVCIFFGARTFVRNGDWRSQFTLYEQAVSAVPDSAKVRMGYANALSKSGRLDEALLQFEESLRLLGASAKEPSKERDDWFPYVTADIIYNMANIYSRKGRIDSAIFLYEQALDIRGDRPEIAFNYGKALLQADRPGEAARIFAQLIIEKPDNYEAYNEQGLAQEKLGDYDAARESFLEAIRLRADYAGAHRNLALLYLTRLGQPRKAVEHFERTLELDPGQPGADKIREALEKYRQTEGGRE